ncbi:MAG: DUF3795 domain-containing protein [Bacteroidaceae bacterium]|nr:DUF3795 domain-containing protein [Bacteroidaceae bacterium]
MGKEVKIDKHLIAYCGLYCGACHAYLKDKCPGCRKNDKAGWCKIRKCCFVNNYHTCADCEKNVHNCKKFNSFMSKIFAWIFKSDREGCIKRIKEVGEDKFAEEMSEKKMMTIKNNKKDKDKRN